SSSGRSSVCTGRPSSRAPASGWPPCSGSSAAMEATSGPRGPSNRGRRFTSPLGPQGKRPMHSKIILLVEDNPDDEALTLRAFQKNNILNEVVVVRDGVEALDYLFGAGAHAGRDLSVHPQVILLDLKLPKVDGLEV